MAGRKEWSPDIVGETEHYKTLQMVQNLLDELDGSEEAGLFTHCNTYHELADYIDDVSDRLREWADWIRDYAKNESFRSRGRMLKESSDAYFDWNSGKFNMEDLIGYIDGNTGVYFDLDGEDVDDDDEVVSWLYDAELDDDGSILTLIRNKDKSKDTLIFKGGDDTFKIDFKKDSQEKCNKILNKILDSIRNSGVEDDDLEESCRPRGRMLRESGTAMPVHYVIGRELFDDKWWPIIVYLNESPDRYWYEAVCADEGGVYHTELGKGYLSRIRPGTDKCAPEVVEAVEDEFFGQFAVDDIPTRRVDSIEDLERYAPADKRLISRD